jgi:hypothetical protein
MALVRNVSQSSMLTNDGKSKGLAWRLKNFISFLSCMSLKIWNFFLYFQIIVFILKIILKNKKNYFNVFLSENFFEPSSLSQS